MPTPRHRSPSGASAADSSSAAAWPSAPAPASATAGARQDTPWAADPPLVGRRADSSALRLRLDDALEGRGGTVLLTGEPGVGKSRLLEELAEEARARQMLLGTGRGFGVEAALPYGTIADLLAAPLRHLEPAVITLLSRGTEHELRRVLPLPDTPARQMAGASLDDGEGSSRLYWTLTQFLRRLAARHPMLLAVDDAHRADPSSLELLHFLARHVVDVPLLLVLAWPDPRLEPDPPFDAIAHSLRTLPTVVSHALAPLTAADVTEWMERAFGLSHRAASPLAERLHAHVDGNPLFLRALLEQLGREGRIRPLADGWQLTDVATATLPTSVREVLSPRLATLTPEANRLLDLVAVCDAPVPLTLLRDACGLDVFPFAEAIDLLLARRVLTEHASESDAQVTFVHPLLHRLARERASAARTQAAHTALADALLRRHGDADAAHAHELAFHLVRANAIGGDVRALQQLTLAGTAALTRRADVDAVRWLDAAARLATRLAQPAAALEVGEALGIAHQRRGDSRAAIAAWTSVLPEASATSQARTRARLLVRIGQESARAGDATHALATLEAAHQTVGAAVLPDADARTLLVRIRVTEAKTWQASGAPAEALAAAHDALALADESKAQALRALAHQTLLQLLAWTGPVADARRHGRRALALAAAAGDHEAEWAAHWALGMLEGFTGHAAGVARHYRDALALAEQLASPLLEAMSAELAIEHASGTGRWDDALDLADRVLPMARAMAPQALLPRLLVWTGLVVLERARWDDARALFTEAWELTEPEAPEGVSEPAVPRNVHNRILAHLGMGAWALARGAAREASDYGERGLAIADRYGYTAWAIHRLLPLVIESDLWLQRYDRVAERAARLRADAEAFEHRLGLAWADAADGFVRRLRDQDPLGTRQLLLAADALDAVPFVLHAARLRRHAAPLLAADGDHTAAVRALRRAHETFARLGADRELRETRSLLRSLGVRLPARTVPAGAATLTARELEIARAIADRRTNKEIGARFGISARTVSTHLSNIFHKLGVSSRGALADKVRDDPALRGP